MKNYRLYSGTFLVAMTTLALQILFTRLLSVITWYYFAFFIIAVAMLGITASAITVYKKPQLFLKNIEQSLSNTSILFSVSIQVSLIMVCILPFLSLKESILTVISIFLSSAFIFLPFYLSGIIIVLVLTKAKLPTGKIYAADLLGACLGCLLVLFAINFLDAPSVILLCSVIALIAGALFNWPCFSLKKKVSWVLIIFLFLFLSIANSWSLKAIRPVVVKGNVMTPSKYLLERWNSYSRIVVYNPTKGESYAGGKQWEYTSFRMTIDSDASTGII